ncbi:MAG: aspartate kinase [Clostridia bacterium]|nr:aspartate kinase [Clostridia bacterium]
MSIVVQKYGGTSVSTEASRNRIAQNAIALKEAGKKPVIVVSAMGRKGAPYATDTLIDLFKQAGSQNDGRNLDLIMSCGESISSAVIANTIEALGHPSVALTGFQAGIITDETFNDANVLEVRPDLIHKYLDKGFIVIVTGFQGVSEEGFITTLGRGGSDHTAAILGEALNAESIEIFTDVDGVMTADPRIVKEAKVLDQISYDEMYQMAVDGAKVVDFKAIAVAKRSGKPLVIKNTFGDAEGTVITSDQNIDLMEFDINALFTAIASKNDIVQVAVGIHHADERNERLLDALEEESVSMDIINFFEDRKVFTINQKDEEKTVHILKELALEYDLVENCSKVTAIGHRIHGVPGVMRKLVLALSKEQIEILQTSDSHTTISCVIRHEHLEKTLNVLHKTFNLSR